MVASRSGIAFAIMLLAQAPATRLTRRQTADPELVGALAQELALRRNRPRVRQARSSDSRQAF